MKIVRHVWRHFFLVQKRVCSVVELRPQILHASKVVDNFWLKLFVSLGASIRPDQTSCCCPAAATGATGAAASKLRFGRDSVEF